jgi:hypothetical protein
MKFTKTVNIWNLTDAQVKALKPGQWVDGGGNKGRFWGVKPSGTVVVAWYHNAKNSGNYNSYNKSLLNYAKAV